MNYPSLFDPYNEVMLIVEIMPSALSAFQTALTSTSRLQDFQETIGWLQMTGGMTYTPQMTNQGYHLVNPKSGAYYQAVIDSRKNILPIKLAYGKIAQLPIK